MAIYHCNKSEVQRSKGQNAVSASAYISRSKLQLFANTAADGTSSTVTYNFRHLKGLAHSVILAPYGSPDWVYDREQLWNKAESSETRVNSETARKLRIALPRELTLEQNIELIEEFALECLVSHGMVADINVHYDNEENPHVHIQMTTRKLETLDTGEVVFGEKGRDWGRREFLHYYREIVAFYINKHLEKYGHLSFVSHLSHKDRGINLVPGIHEGAAHHIKGSRLKLANQLILQENAEKIRNNPELVFDKLSINKPVFTKEDIAGALTEVLHSRLKFKQAQNPKEATDGIDKVIESLNKNSVSSFMSLYSKVLSSDKIGIIVQEDLKGRTLYALTKRLELEERYKTAVQKLANSKAHSLNLTENDLIKAPAEIIINKTIVDIVKNAARNFVNNFTNSRITNFETASETTANNQKQVELTAEQKTAVLNILNGPGISILEGLPGTGKTSVMKEIAAQYKKAGYTVLGTATSSAASLNLEASSGISSKNISLWRKRWQEVNGQEFELALRADYYKEQQYQDTRAILTNKHVLVVDEASMVELANMDYLVNEVKRAGAKIILVGDNNQFSAVGMAGAFKAASDIVKSNKLTEVQRQKGEYAKATKLLGEYKINEALALYKQQNVFRIYETQDQTEKALVNDYINTYIDQINNPDRAKAKSVVICAHTNEAVNKFNKLVREKLKDAGIIRGLGEDFEVNSVGSVRINNKSLELMKGEQILFEANDHKNGILNGEIGTVISFKRIEGKNNEKAAELNALSHGIIKVLLNKADGSKKIVNIDTSDRYTRFTYGYAMTAYKLQGASVDHSLVYYEKEVGYEAFNVMMTRHMESVRLYADRQGLEDHLYNRLDLNTEEARKKYVIKSVDPTSSNQASTAAESWPLWQIGLSVGVSKRSNNSLASSYAGIGESDEDKTIKSYIESNSNVVKLLREIERWQGYQEKTTGTKPDMWEHESWAKVVEHKIIRDESARFIVENREEVQDRINQMELNYATILKHSGNAPYDYEIVEQNLVKSGSGTNTNASKIEFDKNYNEITALVSSIYEKLSVKTSESTESGVIASEHNNIENNNFKYTNLKKINELVGSVSDSYRALRENLIENRLEFAKRKNEYEEVRSLNTLLNQQITDLESYRNKIMPEFLRRIYREEPETVLERWQETVLEHGSIVSASTAVYKDPKILGKLRGIGFGRMYGITNDRVEALENSLVIGQRLRKYEDSLNQIKQNSDLLRENNYEAQEKNLKAKMDEVKPIEPTKIQSEFLQLVQRITETDINITSDSNDLKILKELANEAISKESKCIKLNANFEKEHIQNVLETKVKEVIETINDIIPKRVNINKLMCRSCQYLLAKIQDQSTQPSMQTSINDEQIKASVVRSLFEIKYEKEICDILEGKWYTENNDAQMLLADKIQCKIDANKITKMSGYLLEKAIIDHPTKLLQMQAKEMPENLTFKAIADSMRKYETRTTVIKSILENDMPKEIAGESKEVQISVAAQMVDRMWQTGKDKINSEELTLMKNLATLEQDLVPKMKQYFTEDFQEIQQEILQDPGQLVYTNWQLGKDVYASVAFAVNQVRTKVYDAALTPNTSKAESAPVQLSLIHDDSQKLNFIISNKEYQKIIKQSMNQTLDSINKAHEEMRIEQNIHQKPQLQQNTQHHHIKQNTGMGMGM